MSRAPGALWTIAARGPPCQFSAMPPVADTPRFRLARSEANFYADSGLDRVSERRKDSAWVAERLFHAETRFVPIWRSRNFVDPGQAAAILLTAEEHRRLPPAIEEPIFLGLAGEIAYFASDLSHIDAPDTGPAIPAADRGQAVFLDLRVVGPRLARHEGALLAYARGMLTWHRRHRYCGQCGAPTRAAEGGHVRVCTAEACKLEQFPRTDPAVIMLVTRGDACLLGSNPRYAAARNTGSDVSAFASALQRGGYATDPSYAAKLQAVAAQVTALVGGGDPLKTAAARPITASTRGAT